MRIGIDAQTILNPEMGDAAGLGHYTYQLIKHLLQLDSTNEYVIFVNYRMREKDIEKFRKYNNVKIRRFPFSQYKKFLPGAYSETLATAFFLRDRLDVLFVPGGRMPIGYRGKTVVTAYNLALSRCPDMFPQKEIIRNRIKSPAYKRAEKVIASSVSAKKDLQEFFYVEEKKIEIIHNAFDEKFYKNAPLGEIQKVKEKYGIEGEYILFMNTIKPLNNLPRLIEAFSKLRMTLKGEMPGSNYKLVLAGKAGWLAEEIRQIAKDFGLKKEIIFPGYIVPQDLNALFDGAEVFVSVPVYEEFGSIVLEAFASGLPVVCSNVTSYPEISGGAAKLVDPYDIEGIRDAILEVLRDENLRISMREKGVAEARKFHWENTAKETLRVLEEVAGRN
jgi:glycosyltransferase involved in cell wall biosynthesis